MINRNIDSYDAASLHLCLITPLPLISLANVIRLQFHWMLFLLSIYNAELNKGMREKSLLFFSLGFSAEIVTQHL